MAAVLKKQVDNEEMVDNALKNWGRWLRAVRMPQLAYPRKTNFAVTTSGDAEYECSEAEQVEAIMARLRMLYPELFEALEQEYVHQADNIIAAQRLCISLATYKIYRGKGRSFVAGALGAVL